ncbi:MAG: lysylphosphatidylglycerol synthase transmembrane domain-containing protein [Lachnospiraceae bacterium]
MTKKKMIGNILFLLLIFGLTFYGVFGGEDLKALRESVGRADIRWLLPAVLCVLFFIWGESFIIHYLLRTLKVPLARWKCFLVSSVGFFFSCITPSASGGQPMQIVYMKKENVPPPVSTLVLMIVTITYKLVLVLIGVYLPLFDRGFMEKYLKDILPVYWLGLGLNVVCVGILLLLVFHPMLMKRMLCAGCSLLARMGLMKNRKKWLEKLEHSMQLYRETAVYLKKHFPVILKVLFLTFLQRLSLFAVTWFVYRSFGLKGAGLYELLLLTAVISVTVDMLPPPGGMGISEKLFLVIFAPVFGAASVAAGNDPFPGLSYYTESASQRFDDGCRSSAVGEKEKK